MDDVGPFQMFSPTHLVWLYRVHRDRRDIVAADLDSIEAAQPEAKDDLLFRHYRERADTGQLCRRPGSKPMSCLGFARLVVAKMEIDDEVAAIYARRRSGEETRSHTGDPVCVMAADRVASEWRFHCCGRTLLNKISRASVS